MKDSSAEQIWAFRQQNCRWLKIKRLACRWWIAGKGVQLIASSLSFQLELVWLLNVWLGERLFTACFNFTSTLKSRDDPSFQLTHLHLQSSTTLSGSSNTIVGNAAVDAIVAVFHTQDREKLPILPNAVPSIKEPVCYRVNSKWGPYLWIMIKCPNMTCQIRQLKVRRNFSKFPIA